VHLLALWSTVPVAKLWKVQAWLELKDKDLWTVMLDFRRMVAEYGSRSCKMLCGVSCRAAVAPAHSCICEGAGEGGRFRGCEESECKMNGR
jgi:hypothetical protein